MKKLLVALGALVLLLIIAVVVAPFAVPTDVYTNCLAALVQSATGRDFKISGPVKLSLLPQLQLDGQNVVLANTPGAAMPQMMQIKELQVQLRLRPLLHGVVEVGRFVLVEPVIALEVDKQGHPNWNFYSGTATPAPAASARPAQPAREPTGYAISLGDVRLEHGKISYLDRRTGEARTLDDINAKLSLPDPDSPVGVEGSAVWNNEKVALTLAVQKPRALVLGGGTPVSIKVTSEPVNFAFDGQITDVAPVKLNGAVDLAVPSLRALATWAGTPMAQGPGLGPLAIKGKLDAAGARYAFTDAAIALDAMKGTGSVTVDASGARPTVQGTLAVDRLDLNQYLPPGPSRPAAAGGAPASAAKAEPIDLSALHAADVDFSLSAGALLYRKIEIGQSTLALHLKDAKLTAALQQAALYGGSGKGAVTLDGSGEIPAVAANFDFGGLQIGPLMAAAMGSDRITGRGAFTMAVAARGHDNSEMLRALNGNGSFNISNGVIKGVNLAGMAQTAVSALTRGASTGEETAFGSLTGTYTIGNGILHNNDLRLNSGVVPVQGAGTVNLPEETVNYRLTVQVAGQVPVAIVVTGPIDNLSYRPDLASALETVAKNPGGVLQKLVPSAPGSTRPNVGGALNNLLRR